MQTIANATPAARQEAIASLNLALRRYSHLAEMPRRLQIPLCGDLDAIVRAERKARDRGDNARAEELADWCEREVERREQYALWSSGQLRRSREAWAAMAKRLHVALDWCKRIGVIEGDYVVFAQDRVDDCMAQVRRYDVEARLAQLN